MNSIQETIKEYNLIKKGDVVGIGVSGGSDSMALLNYLYELSQTLDFEVVAIHIDHGIREESESDAKFVANFCKDKNIRCYKFKVNVPKLAKERNQSLETAARDARYGFFNTLLKKGVVDKIALAHHMRDQAETILLHLFRGAGSAGAKGMEIVRDGVYIRPMLNVSKDEIINYLIKEQIDYVDDVTNEDNSYNRNFIRNKILPLITSRWKDAEKAIVSFGKAISEDDSYINSQVYMDAVSTTDDTAKIPTSYFLYADAIISRIIFRACKKINILTDIERKHIDLIKQLAKSGATGTKLNLPNEVTVYKEYDYITIVNKYKAPTILDEEFKCGGFDVEGFGKVIVRRAKIEEYECGELIIDSKKLPKDAKWRFREDGDVFEKFGGGTKKLKSYLIDKKVPQRLRGNLPVLASGNEIYVIAGIEISDKVKIDENTKTAYKITVSV